MLNVGLRKKTNTDHKVYLSRRFSNSPLQTGKPLQGHDRKHPSCKLKTKRKRRGSGDPSGLQNRRDLPLLGLVSSTLTPFRHHHRLPSLRPGFLLRAPPSPTPTH